MNILVTAATGYLGGVCTEELIKASYLVAYDNFSGGHRVKGAKPVEGDIADPTKLGHTCRKFQIEEVVDFAASALVEESVRNPRETWVDRIPPVELGHGLEALRRDDSRGRLGEAS